MNYEQAGTLARQGGSAIGNALAPAPQGRVTEAADNNHRLVESVWSEVQALESRISPILRMPGPTGAAGAEKARNEPSPLGGSIESTNTRLYDVLGYLQSISARVDL